MILAQGEAFGSSPEKCGSSGSFVDVTDLTPPFQMLHVAWDRSHCRVTLIDFARGQINVFPAEMSRKLHRVVSIRLGKFMSFLMLVVIQVGSCPWLFPRGVKSSGHSSYSPLLVSLGLLGPEGWRGGWFLCLC